MLFFITSYMLCIKQILMHISNATKPTPWHPNLHVVSYRADGVYSFTLPQYLERQKHFLHGLEARKLRDTPKVWGQINPCMLEGIILREILIMLAMLFNFSFQK